MFARMSMAKAIFISELPGWTGVPGPFRGISGRGAINPAGRPSITGPHIACSGRKEPVFPGFHMRPTRVCGILKSLLIHLKPQKIEEESDGFIAGV